MISSDHGSPRAPGGRQDAPCDRHGRRRASARRRRGRSPVRGVARRLVGRPGIARCGADGRARGVRRRHRRRPSRAYGAVRRAGRRGRRDVARAPAHLRARRLLLEPGAARAGGRHTRSAVRRPGRAGNRRRSHAPRAHRRRAAVPVGGRALGAYGSRAHRRAASARRRDTRPLAAATTGAGAGGGDGRARAAGRGRARRRRRPRRGDAGRRPAGRDVHPGRRRHDRRAGRARARGRGCPRPRSRAGCAAAAGGARPGPGGVRRGRVPRGRGARDGLARTRATARHPVRAVRGVGGGRCRGADPPAAAVGRAQLEHARPVGTGAGAGRRRGAL